MRFEAALTRLTDQRHAAVRGSSSSSSSSLQQRSSFLPLAGLRLPHNTVETAGRHVALPPLEAASSEKAGGEVVTFAQDRAHGDARGYRRP